MAYNATNEERTELYCERKNNRGDHLVVTKIKNKGTGSESVDIRNYYTNADGELAPTQKGIRINCENLLDVMTALIKALEPNEAEDLAEEIETLLEDAEDYDEEDIVED